MATTSGGSTYVTSTDLVANYPTASLALANRVDIVASGSMSKKTASYTVTVADILAGTTICMNSASATVITLPSTSLVNGMQVNVFSVNTGAVTFTGGTVTGTTTSITAQYSGVSLTWDSAASVWWCLPFGGGSAAASITGTTGSPTITTVGSKTCYKFTGTGSITVGGAGGFAQVLVVGGGGSGGGNGGGTGSGGAGGMLESTYAFLPNGTITVTVGAGGAGTGGGAYDYGNPGITSYIGITGGYLSALGGGGNSAYHAQSTGGSSSADGSTRFVYGQGSAGSAGSGGGAGGPGTGRASSITGTSVTYAKGGTPSGGAGTANLGNGGGSPGSAGGSGVVVILV